MAGFLMFINSHRKSNPQRIITYFLVQAFSTLLFLSRLSLSLSQTSILTKILILMALLIKAGLPPMHLWFIQIFVSLEGVGMVLLRTVQKIIPFFLLRSRLSRARFQLRILYLPILRLTVIGMSRLSGILAYSSVFARVWCLPVSKSTELVILWLAIYSVAMMGVLAYSWASHKTSSKGGVSEALKFLLLISVLSLAGFPPFMGFFIKLYFLNYLFRTGKLLEGLLFLMVTPAFLFAYVNYFICIFKGASSAVLASPSVWGTSSNLVRALLILLVAGPLWAV